MKQNYSFIKQLLIILIILLSSVNCGKGEDKGAYLKTPDASKLEYRLGNGMGGGFDNTWSDDNVRQLMQYAGVDGQRKKLREDLFELWGYGIELGTCIANEKHGVLDVVGYLSKPSKPHSSNVTENSEICYPDHLYEPIWLPNGEVNPNNYWANFVYKTVSQYKKYIKIWETWNEPDYVKYGVDTNAWKTSPPNPKDLVYWNGSIFQYIRLLRITYEVAKKVDPECWVATGGLGYAYFLDAIMRYTDNPDNGKVTDEFPAYGGAYFDCDCFHKYPQWGAYDAEHDIDYYGKGSDLLAKTIGIMKNSHHYIIKKYGFGSKYPDKIFVNTETGLNSVEKDGLGGDFVRRNWIIKSALYNLEYDVKQVHQLNFVDGSNGGFGDYENIGSFVSLEEGYKHLKSSSKSRIILKRMNLGKYIFEKEKTEKFRKSLPKGATGIVLKRKFPKVENEEFYYTYMYSAWLESNDVENKGEIETELDIPFDPLFLDWEGNQKELDKDSTFKLTSTPFFLLGNETTDNESTDNKSTFNESTGISGVAIFFIVLVCIIVLIVLVLVGLYFYKRVVKNQYIPIDKHILKALI